MNSIEFSPSSLVQNITFVTRMRGLGKSSPNIKINKNSTNLNNSISNIDKSKTKQFKTNKSAQKLVNNKIKDNIKYTMFTSSDSSNIMLVSKKPIKGSTINEALKVCDNLYDFHNSILNETSLLEYDKTYNETHSIDKIYNETIKDNIAQLFHKKNSCMLFFGPSSSGKTYLLTGEKENSDNNNTFYQKINYNSKYNNKSYKDNQVLEGGILKRCVNNLINLIKINKQGIDNSSNVKNKYEIRLSIYLIYMDKIYDLLSKEVNNISIQKFYEDDQNININLVGLTDIEIRTVQEYEKLLKEIEYNKKNLSKSLKVKNLDKSSNVVFSLKLQKKIQNTIGTNVTDNYSINSFSQIDFVELIPSEIGLSDQFQDKNDLSYEYNLYTNTKNTYNSICDSIVSSNSGTTPKIESTLSICLKNTLRTNSNIIFFSCVIPWEFPLNYSFKTLKFTTWLRNQVLNEGGNINNSNFEIKNSTILNNSNNLFNTINENKNNISYPNENNNSYFNNNYKNIISQDNNYNSQNYNINKTFPEINNLIGQSIDNGNNQKNILIKDEGFSENNFDINEEKNIRLIRSRSGGLNINNNKSSEFYSQKNNIIPQTNENNNQSNNSQYINITQNLSKNEKTLKALEQTLKELEDKKLEIQNQMIEEKNNNNNYETYNNKINPPNQNVNNQNSQRLKEEQDILKSDNIIMREDISRLSEANQNLENELSENMKVISQLRAENQKLNEENSLLRTTLNDYDRQNYSQLYVNGQISKEDFLQKSFNERYLLQNKLKDLESNYNTVQKEKTQYEVDYKVLLSKYEEIKDKYEKCNYELLNIKQMHDNELYNIDGKINNLSREVEKLQMENTELRQDNEKQRNTLNLLTSERDKYKEKFEEKKYENDLLNKKIFEVESGYNEMMRQKEHERYYKRQKEENHRNKNETKNKIAQELQSKIQQYRRERLQNKKNDN